MDSGPAAVASVATRGYRTYVLGVLVLVYTFNFIDRQITGILAVPIKAELGLSDAQLGLMGGLAFALFYTVLGIPVGRLADRGSRTWIMTGALAIWSLMTAACGLAHSFAQLFVARVGVGVGEAGGVAPAYARCSATTFRCGSGRVLWPRTRSAFRSAPPSRCSRAATSRR